MSKKVEDAVKPGHLYKGKLMGVGTPESARKGGRQRVTNRKIQEIKPILNWAKPAKEPEDV